MTATALDILSDDHADVLELVLIDPAMTSLQPADTKCSFSRLIEKQIAIATSHRERELLGWKLRDFLAPAAHVRFDQYAASHKRGAAPRPSVCRDELEALP